MWPNTTRKNRVLGEGDRTKFQLLDSSFTRATKVEANKGGPGNTIQGPGKRANCGLVHLVQKMPREGKEITEGFEGTLLDWNLINAQKVRLGTKIGVQKNYGSKLRQFGEREFRG